METVTMRNPVRPPAASSEFIPVGILVGYVPPGKKTHARPAAGRLAPSESMILPTADPAAPPRRAAKEEAWWLNANEPVPVAKSKPAAEPFLGRVLMVWGAFAGVMTVGMAAAAWLLLHADRSLVSRGPSVAALPAVTRSDSDAGVAELCIQTLVSNQQVAAVPGPEYRPRPPAPAAHEEERNEVKDVPAPAEPDNREVAVACKEPVEPRSSPAARRPSAPAAPAEQCAVGNGRYGTSVDFVADPTEAAQRAIKEKKLLFVLNISGNFEDDRFT